MAAFFAVDPAWWASARLWHAERPDRWPEWATLIDLRWHADRATFAGVDFPTSDALAKEWRWPKSSVYRLLLRWREWCDPSKMDAFSVIGEARWNGSGTVVERTRNVGGTKMVPRARWFSQTQITPHRSQRRSRRLGRTPTR